MSTSFHFNFLFFTTKLQSLRRVNTLIATWISYALYIELANNFRSVFYLVYNISKNVVKIIQRK